MHGSIVVLLCFSIVVVLVVAGVVVFAAVAVVMVVAALAVAVEVAVLVVVAGSPQPQPGPEPDTPQATVARWSQRARPARDNAEGRDESQIILRERAADGGKTAPERGMRLLSRCVLGGRAPLGGRAVARATRPAREPSGPLTHFARCVVRH